MYISSYRHYHTPDTVFVWERTSPTARIRKEVPSPWYFFVEDEHGTDMSIYGKALTKLTFATSEEFHQAKAAFQADDFQIYESDIRPEIKVLGDNYYGKPPPALTVAYYDIEVDYKTKKYEPSHIVKIRDITGNNERQVTCGDLRRATNKNTIQTWDEDHSKWVIPQASPYLYDGPIGFSSPMDPYAPINAIAVYQDWCTRSIVLAVPPPGWNTKDLDKTLLDITEIEFFKTEAQLLRRFLELIEPADVTSGFNSDGFDDPYTAKRIELVLGQRDLAKLSFDSIAKPRFNTISIFGRDSLRVEWAGRVSLDYLELFKKYSMESRESFKLESIAGDYLPHLPKLSYEGTLADLYTQNFNTFLRYNVRDTEILVGFEKLFGYIKLATTMAHLSCCTMRNVFGTVAATDLAFLQYSHHVLNRRIKDKVEREDGSIKGAFVLAPRMGMHEYIGSLDFTSLYPSVMRMLNLSPETIMGWFVDKEAAFVKIRDRVNDAVLEFQYESGDATESKTVAEWIEDFRARKWCVSGFGVAFDQSRPGVLPLMLTDWFKTRKYHQKLAKQYEVEADAILNTYKASPVTTGLIVEGVTLPDDAAAEYSRITQLSEEHDRLQLVYKIKLNASYGALSAYTSKNFRLELGESVTATGRQSLEKMVRQVNKTLGGSYANIQLPFEILPEDFNIDDQWDEDVDAEQLLVHPAYRDPDNHIVYSDTDSCYFLTGADNIEEAIVIANYVGKCVNDSMDSFCQDAFLVGDDFLGIMKANREVVTGKAIFIQKKRYVARILDKEGMRVDRLKTMGVDVARTNIPKPIRVKMKKILSEILDKTNWEEIDNEILTLKDGLKTEHFFEIGLPKGVNKVEMYTESYNIDPEKTRLPGHVRASILYNTKRAEHNDNTSMPITSGTKIKVFYLKRKIGKFKSIALPTDIDEIPQWFVDEFSELIDTGAHIERLVDNPFKNIFKAINREVPTHQTRLTTSALEF